MNSGADTPVPGRIRAVEVFGLLARLVLAGLFIQMGLSKALNPVEFLKLLREYDILQPPLLLNFVASTLPWFEVFCGLLLLLGAAVRGTAVMLVGMLVPFTVVVLLRALEVHAAGNLPFCAIKFDCGCGTGAVVICRKLAENVLLTALAVALIVLRSHRLCLRPSVFNRGTTARVQSGTTVVSAVFLVVAGLPSNAAQTPPEQILLKDYKPRSIFRIPETRVEKARHPVIDVHSHDYAPGDANVERWVQTMDAVGVEKSLILSGATGRRFDQILAKFGRHPARFIVWCGIDYTGFDRPGFGPAAVAELERCHKAGATGVGELSDKGRGLGATTNSLGMHIDDPRMDPILARCAELRMPVNIHVGEDRWMYEPMDETNDGLMNAWKWRVQGGPGVLTHTEVVDSLERAVKRHPRTTFIACHLANCCSDLNRLGAMFDRYPNLYGDIGARFAELSPIPRTVSQFFVRYQDRILYGTDMNPDPEMYRVTFRLLETADEHFYPAYFRKYHWPMHAWALPDDVLRKIYRENALRLLSRP